jgi:predicted MFS family arabinose efflux permease
MFAGAAIGAMIVKHSVFAALALAAVATSVCSVALLFSLRRDSQVRAVIATP